MKSQRPVSNVTYKPPAGNDYPPKQLVLYPGLPFELRFNFFDRIEIGRAGEERGQPESTLLIMDPTVSSSHCVITQSPNGRCYIRDTSRNGTRLDGKRLVPNTEVEVKLNQRILVGSRYEFIVVGDDTASETAPVVPTVEKRGSTVAKVQSINVTVLVGDIRDYTGLVQRSDAVAVQRAIRRVFNRLEDEVEGLGGTVKEFRGDAIFAYWEEDLFENQAVEACRAALSLNRLARRLSKDPSVWDIADFSLDMEWALATGRVTIDSIGGNRPTGLQMFGPPVVLAFRIEKFANRKTGPIVACPATQHKASGRFEFRDLGEKRAKGLNEAVRVYALVDPE